MERIYNLCDELMKIWLNKKDRSILSKKEKEIIQDIFWGIGVDSYSRFPIFWAIRKELAGAHYWYALGLAYIDTDNLYEHRKEVRRAFTERAPNGRQNLMTAAEQRALAKLPDEVTIYRAMTKKEAAGKTFGVSWTLSKKVAEFFRDDYARNHATSHLEKVIKEKVVKKSDIIAVFNGRKEKEVIYVGATKK